MGKRLPSFPGFLALALALALASTVLHAEAESSAEPAQLTEAQRLSQLANDLVVPVEGVGHEDLYDGFDDRRGKRRHHAIDILAPRGTPVVSAIAGHVMKIIENANGGLMVFAMDNRRQFLLMYAHLDQYAAGLRKGMPLERGQLLGYVGTTGNAPASVPHLHFAIRRIRDGLRWTTATPVNPWKLLMLGQSRPLMVSRVSD